MCTGSTAAAQDPPPLSPPALTPPSVDAPVESPPPERPTPPPENRPVLVVPGVTAPRTRPRPPLAQPSSPSPMSGSPVLDGPNDLFAPTHPPSASPRLIPQPSSPPSVVPRPLTLERVPGTPPADPKPGPSPAPERNLFRPQSPTSTPNDSRRPSGVFSRLLPAPSFLTGRAPTEPKGLVTVEPRSDPATDAALKRRIERQIRESLGNRVRSVDVRVVDRDVTIRAKSARFWQRRGVRHTLESLPALVGYHAQVEMSD